MIEDLPGWLLSGTHPQQYTVDLGDREGPDGRRAAGLRFAADEPGGFATVMQTIDASAFRGRRIRFRALVRSELAGRGGLWMRVDEPDGLFSAFDNMQDRQIIGTTAWERHDVVLDVGERSGAVAFGLLLEGAGAIWFCDVAFEEVGVETPTTGGHLPLQPQNLDLAPSLGS
jgi:hypothetical protein